MVIAVLGVFPSAAGATVAGPNGPFAFASGRDDGGTAFGDANAQLWLLPGPGLTSLRLSSGFNTSMHRHPTWSPDRTKIAYARCQAAACGFTGPWDIYVQDLVRGGPPVDITNSALSEDRPSWSPDGTRIAYAKEVVAATRWDIVLRPAGGGAETTVGTFAANGAGGWKQARAQWTPGSDTLVYGKRFTDTDYELIKAPANGSNTAGTPVNTSTANLYQPAVSPDGQRICFTLDNNAAPNFKDIAVAPISGTPVTPLVTGPDDDFECSWSPDGKKIAYGRGGFGNGQIRVINADGSGGDELLTDNPGRFDGNVDWAPNPSPACSGQAATVFNNASANLRLGCADAPDPPAFALPNVARSIVAPPAHGTLGPVGADGAVTYTPNPGFVGADSFSFRGSDGTSSSAPATVSVKVIRPPKCGGRSATIVGTSGKDNLVGTAGKDVIVAGRGNDRVRAGRGNDIVCAGSGKDRVFAGRGNDRVGGGSGNDSIAGESGKDRLSGDSGNDRVSGGSGNDSVSGGSGNDKVSGDSGRDIVSGGSGKDRLSGGSGRDRCSGGSGRDRARRCERSSRIP